MRNFIKRLNAAVQHPYLELITGLILVSTALAETGSSIVDDLLSGHFRVHHGVIVLGLVHCIKALSSLLSTLILISDSDRKAS